MSSGLLQGKRGIIFGVANERSIAWGCAEACAAAGAQLAFNYLGEAQEKRVKSLLKSNLKSALCYPCDVQKDGEIKKFFENIRHDWREIDFVIHSVAYAERDDLKGRFVDTPREHFRIALDISAYSLAAIARAAEPLFGASGGSIMSMTYYGAEKVLLKYNVMGVAKAALEASSRYLAADLGPAGIRVNCISAGPVRTLSSGAFPGFRQMLRVTEETAPLRRNITPGDVGNTAVYLASDLSSNVTGEVLHVDAGYNILGMFGNEDA